ncbi:hypothetical protein GE061_007464 [Apolygus lucorum]|uniref:Insulin receptor substrate 1 n=1 Tax=Apolygus lucorum TaxID=248454 RepID=A0A8S9WTN6_APOLU|nr:hypothetical protein GE061_007464 [Apolygus lucorum]
MAVAKDKPVKEGFLLVPPPKKVKKWQKKYCVLYSYSNLQKDRLEIYENEEEASKLYAAKVIIPLENCVKISLDPQKNQRFAFSIITKHATHLFSCLSSEESHDWVCACQGVAFRDTFSSTTIEEDNELYCPSGDGIFTVVLVSTDASDRCGLSPGDYVLVVAPEELQLRIPGAHNLLYTWPFRFIRRYGHKKGRFNFEAGRKCASGEGTFDFEHNCAQDIFKCITTKMESMKQRLGGSSDRPGTLRTGMSGSMDFLSTPRSPEIGLPVAQMDVDEELAAAMTMSARSRSPLVSISSTMTPINVNTVVQTLAPMKPPRKNPPVPAPSPRYDQVEVRSDAWRTLGSDSPAHVERAPVQPQHDRPYPHNAVFLRPPPPFKDFTHSDYDKLDHFGSTPKLDEDPSYSTISRQDTSGYGVIRKVQPSKHEMYNEYQYAVVVKTPHQASHKV